MGTPTENTYFRDILSTMNLHRVNNNNAQSYLSAYSAASAIGKLHFEKGWRIVGYSNPKRTGRIEYKWHGHGFAISNR